LTGGFNLGPYKLQITESAYSDHSTEVLTFL